MQSRRIEVSSVGPDQRVNFRIDANLIEQRQVTERPIEFAGQDRVKVNSLLRVVVKAHAQDVGCDDLECLNSIDGMNHSYFLYLSGSIGTGL